MAKMNLPRVLVDLGYQVGPLTDWGNNATSDSVYEDLALTWPTGNAPLKSKEEFEAAWETVETEDQAVRYKEQRAISGYIEINNQLDMLYWDVHSGAFGDEAKNSAWFQHCSGVKEEFPKP